MPSIVLWMDIACSTMWPWLPATLKRSTPFRGQQQATGRVWWGWRRVGCPGLGPSPAKDAPWCSSIVPTPLPHPPHRVLIVDWDVHHGQGTQFAFDQDPRYASSATFDARLPATPRLYGPNQKGPRKEGKAFRFIGPTSEPGSVLFPACLHCHLISLRDRVSGVPHFTDGGTKAYSSQGHTEKWERWDRSPQVLGDLVHLLTLQLKWTSNDYFSD